MASLLLLIISIFIVPFSLPSHESSVNTINITNSSQLVQYLCHSTFKTDLQLVLISPSIYRITDNESLCEVRVHGILYIMGTSHHTVIHCNSTIGFVFNSYSVIIYSVTIKNCGAPLHKLNVSFILPIINKEMSSSCIHYAAIFINSKVNITSTNFNFYDCNNGGGIFIYYSDHQEDNKANLTSVDVANSRVNQICDNHNAVSGLTLLYTQKNFHVKTKVHSSRINATLLIISHYATTETIIDDCIFSGHHNGLVFYGKISHIIDPVNVPLVIKSTNFSNNRYTSAIKINVTSVVPLTIVLTNIVFINNTHGKGPCMYAVENTDNNTANLTILMSNVSAFYNSLTDSSDAQLKFGLLNFQGKVILHLFNGLYCSNYGSVFGLYYGVTLIVTGKLIFKDNVAQNGAALILHHSNLILNGTNLQFLNNTALEKGGAIYADNANISILMTTNNKVNFTNNAAFMSGNSIYAYPIENKTTLERFNFTPITNNHLHEVSTTPVRIIPCEQQHDYKHVYAGEKITLMMKALDQWSCSVFNYVFISVAKASSVGKPYPQFLSSDWHIPLIDYYQIIEERNDNTCTALNLTLLTGEDKENTGVILVSTSGFKFHYKNKINLKPCPIGFENTHDICHCDALIGNATNGNCYITNKTIISHNIFWIGNYNTDNGPSLAYSKYCPVTYCSIRDQLSGRTTIKVTDNNEFKIVTTDGAIMDICGGNRSGVLCGKCVNGTSVVLGSDKCYVCNNWWLLSLLLYAIVGPLVIYLLYALKLTLTTGTLNGIIFYAQAANCGLLDFIVYPTYYHDGILTLSAKIVTAFLAFLNLQNGFSFCLYNGMTTLAKDFFTLSFVVYLLLLVLLVIILSRYSTRLSNHIANSSVQVLVTVVHLSFYHLMDTVLKVFSSTEVYTKNVGKIHVWSFDGSVGFLSKEHVTLIIFTLVIVMALLLPYIVILLGGRLLLKYCDKLRPVYEAIHGPYKEKNNYWFTARLLLLIVINIIYISLRSINVNFIVLFTGVLLILFIIAQAHIKPFKNKFINMLDLFVMVLFGFQYVFSWYAIINEEKSWYYVWTFVVSALLLFTIFIAIIIGHILWVTGKWHKIKLLFRRQMSCGILRQVRGSRAGYDEPYYGSCQIREPVLDI